MFNCITVAVRVEGDMLLHVYSPGGSIDVNLLLTRLLAKGLIGQKDTSQSGSESSASGTSSAITDSAAAAVGQSDVSIVYVCLYLIPPLELHLTISELWFGQEQEGMLS